MLKILLIILAFCYVLKGSDSIIKKENPELCKELRLMMYNDQKFRKLHGFVNESLSLLIITDSLKSANNISQEEYNSWTKNEKTAFEIKAKTILDTYPKFSPKEKDSIQRLMIDIDHYNSKRFIEIVREYGWVTRQSLNCKEYFGTWVFLRHSPKKFFPEIRKLIEKERKANRLNADEYMLIDNHLKGRPMLEFKYDD